MNEYDLWGGSGYGECLEVSEKFLENLGIFKEISKKFPEFMRKTGNF